jgi:hypothetical protein
MRFAMETCTGCNASWQGAVEWTQKGEEHEANVLYMC